MEKGFKDFVDAAKAEVREVTLHETQQMIDSGEPVIVLDVREDYEWARGRILGAVHLGRGVLERDAHKLIPDRDAEIITYCGGGSRSALAAKTLKEMGYTNVKSMIGGFGAWKEASNPIEA